MILRIKNGESYQNIGTIGFNKSDAAYYITINSPDISNSESKTISATPSTGGILSISVTRGSVCDATLIFDEYTDLLFTSKLDNSSRVCYKAYFPVN